MYVYSLYGQNYFDVSAVTKIYDAVGTNKSTGVTVQQAYNIDNKIDDGLPQSGSVLAAYVNGYIGPNAAQVWAAGYPRKGLVLIAL